MTPKTKALPHPRRLSQLLILISHACIFTGNQINRGLLQSSRARHSREQHTIILYSCFIISQKCGSLPLPRSLKELEKKIQNELKQLGIISFRIDNYNNKTGAIEHTIGYSKQLSNETMLKVSNVIRKHFSTWKKDLVKSSPDS